MLINIISLGKSNHILILFLLIFSLLTEQKLLANNSTQEPNQQRSTKIAPKNQEQVPLDSWLEIIQQNQETLLPQELALIKSKIASTFFSSRLAIFYLLLFLAIFLIQKRKRVKFIKFPDLFIFFIFFV